MPATIATELDRVRHELRTARRLAHQASTRHDSRALGRALRELEELERLEDSLRDVCECDRPECPGSYKPDGSHDLAF